MTKLQILFLSHLNNEEIVCFLTLIKKSILVSVLFVKPASFKSQYKKILHLVKGANTSSKSCRVKTSMIKIENALFPRLGLHFQ